MGVTVWCKDCTVLVSNLKLRALHISYLSNPSVLFLKHVNKALLAHLVENVLGQYHTQYFFLCSGLYVHYYSLLMHILPSKVEGDTLYYGLERPT